MQTKEFVIDTLRYPFTDWKKFLILFIIVFFSVGFGELWIVPILLSIISSGYVMRIIESTLEDSNKLPEFSDLKKILIDGLKYVIVGFLYSIPLYVVTFLMMGSLIQEYSSTLQIDLGPSIVVGFVINIFYLMGLAHMVHEKTIKGAFAFKKILKLINQISWKKYLICLVFYAIVTTIVSLIPNFLIPSTFVSLSDFIMFFSTYPGAYSDVYSTLAFYIINGLLVTYTLAFTGRFIGLIYPNKENNE